VRKNDRLFARALETGEDVQQESVVAVLPGRNAELEALELVRLRVEAVAPRLGGERRFATTKSKVLRRPSVPLKCGLERLLSCSISAVGQSCRIMFIRASALVALSISCP
jgi:hypothetical protein